MVSWAAELSNDQPDPPASSPSWALRRWRLTTCCRPDAVGHNLQTVSTHIRRIAPIALRLRVHRPAAGTKSLQRPLVRPKAAHWRRIPLGGLIALRSASLPPLARQGDVHPITHFGLSRRLLLDPPYERRFSVAEALTAFDPLRTFWVVLTEAPPPAKLPLGVRNENHAFECSDF